MKLDFLNLNNTVAHTFRGLQAIDLKFRPKHKASRICAFQNCQKLSIDNSDLGTVQPKATAGMINVDELRVVNSKVVTCRIKSHITPTDNNILTV